MQTLHCVMACKAYWPICLVERLSLHLHRQLLSMYTIAGALLAKLCNTLHGSSACCHPNSQRLTDANHGLGLRSHIWLWNFQTGTYSRSRWPTLAAPSLGMLLLLKATQHIPATKQSHVMLKSIWEAGCNGLVSHQNPCVNKCRLNAIQHVGPHCLTSTVGKVEDLPMPCITSSECILASYRTAPRKCQLDVELAQLPC